MEPPRRPEVPTCIGCGAMSRLGSCGSGCSEQRLDLVRAVAHDELATLERALRARLELQLPVIQRLTGSSTSNESEAGYRELQARSRNVLRSSTTAPDPQIDAREPSEAATTWWCARCGGIDAPQPCLGICVWRTVEWVPRDAYERRRDRVVALQEAQACIESLLRRLAWSTPRAGQWERSWGALRSGAGEAIRACAAAQVSS